MANTKSAPAEIDVDELFEGIDSNPAAAIPSKSTKSSTKNPRGTPKSASQTEQDILAELDDLAAARPASRPHTPRVPVGAGVSGPKSRSAGTGASTPARTSEEKAQPLVPRKSGESSRSYHEALTPGTSESNAGTAAESEKPQAWETPATTQQEGASGGWWGGILATASAAVKTAEAAVKEIQQNEEAKRWTEQVKGNVGALRGLGGELRSRALPTFTNILHTLAPPISAHERLQIHITHDLVNYPSLDPLIYSTFSRVMAQVEGGDLLVIQRGQESSPRRGSDVAYPRPANTSGWNDGPWWRQSSESRDIGAVKGMVEGTKLVKASVESYAHDFYASRGGIEEAAKRAAEVLSDSNPVRSSDIFLAIQAISHPVPEDLFLGSSADAKAKEAGGVVEPKADEQTDGLITFAIYLHDPVHSITFHALTQSLPQKWIDWLDASSQSADPANPQAESNVPEDIAEIISTGGVDPREWVAEWVEEALTLGVGVVAQRYVARRMGVGEGGIGRGKRREEALESGGGEAARAV